MGAQLDRLLRIAAETLLHVEYRRREVLGRLACRVEQVAADRELEVARRKGDQIGKQGPHRLHGRKALHLGKSLVVEPPIGRDRKSTRLNSSHVRISYAVF